MGCVCGLERSVSSRCTLVDLKKEARRLWQIHSNGAQDSLRGKIFFGDDTNREKKNHLQEQ